MAHSLPSFLLISPFTLVWRRGLVKQNEASNEAPVGAGYTIEPLWGNGLAHFRGQKGACLSKESPLFTFIAEMQPPSAVKSLTMSHADTHTTVYWNHWYCSLHQHANSYAHSHRYKYEQDKTELNYMPRCFTASSYLYSVANSNYHQAVYCRCTFLCYLRSEWICWVKAFSLFSTVADSENAPTRIL